MNKSCRLRTFVIFALFVFLYAIAVINLFMLQIIDYGYFANLAHKQHNLNITTNPLRGLIFDRNYQPVAINKDSLSAFIVPYKIENIKQLKQFLKKYFPQALEKLKINKNKYFMYIKRKLTSEQLDLIKQNNIIDIKILKEPSRFYPVESMGPITGFTDIDNNGLLGIELQYNNNLAGSPTTVLLEKDARSGYFYFNKATLVQGQNGKSIMLTIDSNLQFLIQEELKDKIQAFNAKEGAAVVINPIDGHILAMVSFPSLDLNNKVISDVYEFGSVMKIFVALALLEENLVTIDEIVDCENKKETKVDGMTFTTWKEHGLLPFSSVIEKSNNIGMVKVAKRLDKKLYNHYIKMGFNKKTNISLPNEQKGFITHPNQWSKRSIISLSFGYEINATLLQLAMAFCTLANDGKPIEPRIIVGEKIQPIFSPIYSKRAISQIKEIMQNTVNRGTAKKAAIKGYKIMGKTGSAHLAVNGAYSKTKNIYTFAGIVEVGNYKRVIATFIKEPESVEVLASMIVAPLFEQIAEKILIHDKII